MAKIVTQTTYIVEAGLLEVLRKIERFSEAQKKMVTEAVEAFKSPAADSFMVSTLRFPFESEAEANSFLALLSGTKVDYFDVPSESTYGYYQVGVSNNTTVNCTCPDWQHRSKTNPAHVCKHMAKVQRNILPYLRR